MYSACELCLKKLFNAFPVLNKRHFDISLLSQGLQLLITLNFYECVQKLCKNWSDERKWKYCTVLIFFIIF